MTSKKCCKSKHYYILYKLAISVGIELEQEADSFKISANMPYICSKKLVPASRYFVAILNIALRNWNTYYT